MDEGNSSYFQYVAQWTSLAQNNETTQDVRIDAGSDFIIQGLMATAWFSSGSEPTGADPKQLLYRDAASQATQLTSGSLGHLTFKLQVTDYIFQNIAIPLNLIAGTAERPFMLPTSIIVPRNDSIQASLKNNLPALTGSATPAIDAYVVFVGRKHFGSQLKSNI